ncbi:MAG TPA: outer membrane beta-barrel protein [Gemmatimonadaceae bacterium]|nr:outer membrane beta-barrel protein [Gemmatimonadaceae bacterium]
MRIGTGAAAIFALAVAAAPLSAQQRGLRVIDESSDEVVQFTPYVGYLTFGDFFSRRTGSSMSSDDAAVVGAQLALKLAPNISAYGNLGYARSNTQVDVPLAETGAAANTNVWLYDGGLQFSVPTGPFGRGSVKPFFQIGAGAMHYDFDDGGPGVPSTSATNFAWNAGVGIDARISRSIGVRFMAKDYIGRFNLQDISGENIRAPVTQNFALSAGLRFGF